MLQQGRKMGPLASECPIGLVTSATLIPKKYQKINPLDFIIEGVK